MTTTTSTLTLSDFLLARYAELDPDDLHNRYCAVNSYVPFPCDCGEPARAAADIEAKRRIVGHCQTMPEPLSPGQNDRDLIQMALALPFADHPDYRQEWAL